MTPHGRSGRHRSVPPPHFTSRHVRRTPRRPWIGFSRPGQAGCSTSAPGRGKLTRQLLAKGWDVVAVEPSDGMRQQLRRSLPSVPALKGTAEDIPLDDAAVDVVLVAQAWHWVDVDRAVPEVARVLVPGGRLGLVWNERDERHDWVAQLSRAISSPDEVERRRPHPSGLHLGLSSTPRSSGPSTSRPRPWSTWSPPAATS